jgi:Coenzyme PQQ synthesis protein D (PqqD)
MPLINSVPKVRSKNIVVQDLGDEVLIYDLKTDKAYCLNETARIVWQACDGRKNIAEITENIGKKLKLKVTEDFVWFALNQLKKEKLLENCDQLPNHFAGISRREVIKKIGVGCLAALPIIGIVSIPTAAQSNSTCIPFGICVCNMIGFLNGETCPSSDCMTAMTGCVCGNLMNCMMGTDICNGTCQVP